jgi:hypothetical protein
MPSSRRPSLQLFPSDTAALWLTGLAFTALHIATSGRYGFHRDELLTYTNARHLDWCYVVYPPVTAWLARVELMIFGTSLTGFRFLAAVSIGLLAVLAGLIAREMGGKRQAMLVAAVAASIAGPVAFAGSFFSYMTFDLLCWVAVAWCTARLLRSQDPRWWVAIGAAIGIGIMSKYTMLFLAAGVLGGMLLTANRRFLRSVWFWCGIAVALVIVSPVVFWQFQHHFVGLDWMKSIHARDIGWGRADYFLPKQFWKVMNPVTVPLWCAGLWFLFAKPQGKPFRMIGWMYVIPLLTFLAARGRDYYLAPAYPMLLAAGAVWGEHWLASIEPRAQAAVLRTTWSSLLIGGLITMSLVVPVAPVDSTWWRVADAANDCFRMEIGWPELAATVAQVRDSLPAADRAHLGILAGDEGETGAINLYGQAHGLPPAISGMNSNWLRGYGDPPPQTIIAVGLSRDFLERNFLSCTWAAHPSNSYGVVNETIGEVYVCGGPRQGWPEFWKRFQYYG